MIKWHTFQNYFKCDWALRFLQQWVWSYSLQEYRAMKAYLSRPMFQRCYFNNTTWRYNVEGFILYILHIFWIKYTFTAYRCVPSQKKFCIWPLVSRNANDPRFIWISLVIMIQLTAPIISLYLTAYNTL